MKKNCVYSFLRDNRPKKDLTISETLFYDNQRHLTIFSLGADTGISQEFYPGQYLYLVLEGAVRFLTDSGEAFTVKPLEILSFPVGSAYEIQSPEDSILVEIGSEKEYVMKLVPSKEVYSLKNLLPVESGKIVNADLVDNDAMKFVLMSFDAGCVLPEHAAPGEAVFFCLDGEGIIVNDGVEYPIHAGENFTFEPGRLHSVKAVTPFKMALVLVRQKK